MLCVCMAVKKRIVDAPFFDSKTVTERKEGKDICFCCLVFCLPLQIKVILKWNVLLRSASQRMLTPRSSEEWILQNTHKDGTHFWWYTTLNFCDFAVAFNAKQGPAYSSAPCCVNELLCRKFSRQINCSNVTGLYFAKNVWRIPYCNLSSSSCKYIHHCSHFPSIWMGYKGQFHKAKLLICIHKGCLHVILFYKVSWMKNSETKILLKKGWMLCMNASMVVSKLQFMHSKRCKDNHLWLGKQQRLTKWQFTTMYKTYHYLYIKVYCLEILEERWNINEAKRSVVSY